MRSIRSLVLGTATAAAAVMVASPANAAIVLCYYNGPGDPACPQTNANVNVDTVTGSTVLPVRPAVSFTVTVRVVVPVWFVTGVAVNVQPMPVSSEK